MFLHALEEGVFWLKDVFFERVLSLGMVRDFQEPPVSGKTRGVRPSSRDPSSESLRSAVHLWGRQQRGLLRKVCGNSGENPWNFARKYVLLRQQRVRKFCAKFAEISRKFAKIFCSDPFPNDPTSELLIRPFLIITNPLIHSRLLSNGSLIQLRPKGRNSRDGTRLRCPEFLDPLRASDYDCQREPQDPKSPKK